MFFRKYFKLTTILLVGACLIIALVPFFAFMTVWFSSITGHYTAWRLWDEIVLLLIILGCLWILFRHRIIWNRFRSMDIVWLITLYVLYELVIGSVSLFKHDVSLKALGYGLVVDLRFFLFFLACWIIAGQSGWLRRNWEKLVLIPAAIVVVFGLMQHFILPYNFLSHFGYGTSTIPPFQTINQNLHYVRILSTLRGSNPLGAYLVVIIAIVSALLVKRPSKRLFYAYTALLIGSIITLFYTYSRSAWIAAALVVVIIGVLNIRSRRVLKRVGLGMVVLFIAIGLLLFGLRNSSILQDTIFHTDSSHHTPQTSNSAHLSALKSGIKDAIAQPLGDGPGTAGPASVYNNHPARIAENYFIQIVQEVGWLGLFVFLAINWLVAKELWKHRQDSLALGLLASLVGICFVGLLSHVWVDDTLSYVWWGLGGICLSAYYKTNDKTAAH